MVCLRLPGVEAQTDTPNPTLTRTATRTPDFNTFTPEATDDSADGSRFLCPEEPVFSSDVPLRYLTECGHCVTHVTSTPEQVSHGLPRFGLPTVVLRTPSATPTGIWFPRTSTPSPFLTVYPTITPGWMGEASTAIAGFTSTPVMTSTPTFFSTHINFVEAFEGGFEGWGITGSGDIEVYSVVFDDEFPFAAFNPYTGTGVPGLGFSVRWIGTPGLVELIGYEFDYINGVRGCSGACGSVIHANSAVDEAVLDEFINNIGYPSFQFPYSEGVPVHFERSFNADIKGLTFFVSQNDTSGIYRPDYIEDLWIYYRVIVEPGAATATPTTTLTPAPDIDCRNPDTGIEHEVLVETDAFEGGLQAISRTCFTVIDPSLKLDLSGLNAAWVVDPDDLEICVVLYRVPFFALIGIPLPLEMVLLVMIIAYLVRLFRSY